MNRPVAAVDIFCGLGGLSLGLKRAGIRLAAGIDLDPACEYPFTRNLGAAFQKRDVRQITGSNLAELFPADAIRLLAGCAPCQPFSSHRRGADTSEEEAWSLLGEFSRLVDELRPELVTMENVPRLVSKSVYEDLLTALRRMDYFVDAKSVYCPRFGIPQHRRRLVVVASKLGSVQAPAGPLTPSDFRTVRDAIGQLPALAAGASDPVDTIHRARALSPLNLQRLKASKPGGTWEDWPERLRAPCHRRSTGSSFRNVYARMNWDEPAPTITTEAYNFGTGRFGHPEQDRPISLREAALLQGFPANYEFARAGEPVHFSTTGRLIGNAVPPPLGFFIGKALLRSLSTG